MIYSYCTGTEYYKYRTCDYFLFFVITAKKTKAMKRRCKGRLRHLILLLAMAACFSTGLANNLRQYPISVAGRTRQSPQWNGGAGDLNSGGGGGGMPDIPMPPMAPPVAPASAATNTIDNGGSGGGEKTSGGVPTFEDLQARFSKLQGGGF